MRPLQTDMSVYKQFNFENPPVGIKYLYRKPEGIEPLDKKLALCEMVREAQQRKKPFYFTKENESCFGKSFLGMAGDSEHFSDGGELGVKFEIFQDGRANIRLRSFFVNMEPGSVNYVAAAPLDALTFEPDLLIIMAKPNQAEIILRAMTYSTGEMYENKATLVGGCAWLYVYPYISGKVNYMITGLAFGMKAKQVFPEGWILMSIPYQWIPTITKNLGEMKWAIPAYTMGKEKFVRYEHQILKELAGAPPKL
jgi:uncharacterized protein (DUF169 family)